MDTQSKVLTADLEFEGKIYTASYFLERDIIHANIDGRVLMTPLGASPANETVRVLLLEWLLEHIERPAPP